LRWKRFDAKGKFVAEYCRIFAVANYLFQNICEHHILFFLLPIFVAFFPFLFSECGTVENLIVGHAFVTVLWTEIIFQTKGVAEFRNIKQHSALRWQKERNQNVSYHRIICRKEGQRCLDLGFIDATVLARRLPESWQQYIAICVVVLNLIASVQNATEGF